MERARERIPSSRCGSEQWSSRCRSGDRCRTCPTRSTACRGRSAGSAAGDRWWPSNRPAHWWRCTRTSGTQPRSHTCRHWCSSACHTVLHRMANEDGDRSMNGWDAYCCCSRGPCIRASRHRRHRDSFRAVWSCCSSLGSLSITVSEREEPRSGWRVGRTYRIGQGTAIRAPRPRAEP